MLQKECIVIIAEVAAAEIDWELKIRNEKRGKLLNGCKKLSASQLVTEMPREAFFLWRVETWGEKCSVFPEQGANKFISSCERNRKHICRGVNQLLF